MIEWTIPRVNALTGYSEATESNFTEFSYRNVRIDGEFGLATESGKTAFGGTSFTSHGETGQTTFSSFSSSFSFTFANQGIPEDGVSDSDVFATGGQTTSSRQTIAAATSTVDTREIGVSRTVLTAVSTSVWTNTSDSFFTISSTVVAITNENVITTQSFDTTTHDDTTFDGLLHDTIVQAESSEVIWYHKIITNWKGLSAATNEASSDTRITITPHFQLVEIPRVTQLTTQDATSLLGNVAHQWTHEESSYSFDFKQEVATETTVTIVTQTHLPNLTATQTRFALTTETTSMQVTLFDRSEKQLAADEASTRERTLATSSFKQPGVYYSGKLEWDALRTTNVQFTFTTQSPIVLCRLSASSTETNEDIPDINGFSFSASGASGFSSALNVEQNQFVFLPPSCQTSIGQEVKQSKFVPRAAKNGSSSGLFYELNVETTLQNVTYAAQARNELTTIFPAEIKGVVTFNSDSVTFTRSAQLDGQTTTTTTTATALVRVAGESTTTTVASGPISVWGGYPAQDETFANVAAGSGGVYRNQNNGQTIAVEAGATTFTNSVQQSYLLPILGIVAPIGLDEQTQPSFGYFVVARNSSALPPAMPPSL